jgi:hypothetical protein
MALSKRAKDGIYACNRHDRFQPNFLHLLQPARLADGRPRAFPAEKCSRSRRTKTAR